MLRLVSGLAVSLLVASVTAGDPPSLECWKTQLTNGAPTVVTEKTAFACPVWIGFAGAAPSVNVNEPIQFAWKIAVRNATESSNLLQMPAPPGVTFSQTYVRACADTTGACDPATPATIKATAPLSALAAADVIVPVKSNSGDFKFKTPGTKLISAQVELLDAADPTTSYVFAAYTSVTVTSSAARDSRIVFCRSSAQAATDASLQATKSLAVGSQCDLQIHLDAVPVAHPNASSSISWTASIAPQPEGTATFALPATINTSTVDGKPFEIVNATVKVCKDASKCDEYTNAADLLVYPAGSANFVEKKAKFHVDKVTLPSDGTFTAFLHLVLSGGASQRFDFMYYFPVVSSQDDIGKSVTSKKYALDGATVYCWRTLAATDEANVSASSVVVAGEGTDCPYGVQLALTGQAGSVGTAVTASWGVSPNVMFSPSTLGNVTLAPVYDDKTHAAVTLPVVNLYACKGNCTPFAGNKTLLFASAATNLTSEKAKGSTTVKLPESGTFTVFAHVITSDASDRIDTAVFANITVGGTGGDNEGHQSYGLLYVVLALGAVVFVAVIIYTVMWVRRSRDRDRMERMAEAFKVFHTSNVPTSIHTEDHFLDPPPPQTGVQSNHDYVLSEESPAEVDEVDSLSFDPYESTDLGLADMSVNSSKLSFAFSESERGSEAEAYDV